MDPIQPNWVMPATQPASRPFGPRDRASAEHITEELSIEFFYGMPFVEVVAELKRAGLPNAHTVVVERGRVLFSSLVALAQGQISDVTVQMSPLA